MLKITFEKTLKLLKQYLIDHTASTFKKKKAEKDSCLLSSNGSIITQIIYLLYLRLLYCSNLIPTFIVSFFITYHYNNIFKYFTYNKGGSNSHPYPLF
ncbi:hypothetical protein CDO51_00865 [Natranaerobius trueperi]|uniref:Uncharacterized protein n=1 Tax=Natranaerobius trueperi TaxID=759412 RepID=A0A226C2X9_9FIRM|nr:hypothetical protein CDO51_00865 [Natranaerobius trueperi]